MSEGGREGGREGEGESHSVFDQANPLTESISHEDRSMSNAKALLQSAWLGDAVTLRRCLVRPLCLCSVAFASLSSFSLHVTLLSVSKCCYVL